MVSTEAAAIVNEQEKETRINEGVQIIKDIRFHEREIQQLKARLAELDAGAQAATEYITVQGNRINFQNTHLR